MAGGSTIRRFGLNSSVGPTAALPASATAAPVVAGDVVYVPHQGGVSTFTLALAPLATLPVAGSIDHLTVADGHVLAVHHPTVGGPARLSVFALPA